MMTPLDALQKAIEIDPYYVKAWNSIGLALMALERFLEVEAAFARADLTWPAQGQGNLRLNGKACSDARCEALCLK